MTKTTKKYIHAKAGQQSLLAVFRASPGVPKTIGMLAREASLDLKKVKDLITHMRGEDHNIRNKHGVGFWLEDGPVPEGEGGPGAQKWKSEPPITLHESRRV